MHERGLRVTLNVHPADGVRPHEDAFPAMARRSAAPPTTPIPFDVTDRAFLDAYFDVLHRGLEDDGVDFWWLDWQSGPHSRVAGIDPLWMLNHFHFLDSARDGRRPLTFSRYAGPGSHRYPVGFSGDTVISWASLAFQPYFTATASNIGYGWWSHDIGGHMFGGKDDELATRWVQLGVFSPILRLHSGRQPVHRRRSRGRSSRPRATVMTEHLRLRHRLLPYLHTMNHRAASDGRPLVEPLYHRVARGGRGLRPAEPVPVRQRAGGRAADRPGRPAHPARLRPGLAARGTWVDVFTGLVYDGGRELLLHRDLTSIPVLAAAGAIVPLDGAPVPGNDPVNPASLEVLVVVGADGSFTLVEDDGTDDGVARTRARRYSRGTFTVRPRRGSRRRPARHAHVDRDVPGVRRHTGRPRVRQPAWCVATAASR